MNFAEAMKNELSETKQFTENGAVGYTTTGKKLLDLNFAVSSLRNATEQEIIEKFKDAYYENPKYAIKWLFYARDVREGLGERRLFRIIMKNLAIDFPQYGWEVNKGYPTRAHRAAIEQYGTTPYHRTSFRLLDPNLRLF